MCTFHNFPRSFSLITSFPSFILHATSSIYVLYLLSHELHKLKNNFYWPAKLLSQLKTHVSTYRSKSKTLQNKTIRIISNPIYKKIEVLQIHDLFDYETAKFVYSCFYNQAPILFKDYFTRVDEVSQRTARQSVDKFSLYTPTVSRTGCKKAQGIKELNHGIPFQRKSSHSNFNRANLSVKHFLYPSATTKNNLN